jgi:hypothetical protein
LQSIMPAPVRSRRALTSVAVIVAIDVSTKALLTARGHGANQGVQGNAGRIVLGRRRPTPERTGARTAAGVVAVSRRCRATAGEPGPPPPRRVGASPDGSPAGGASAAADSRRPRPSLTASATPRGEEGESRAGRRRCRGSRNRSGRDRSSCRPHR